MLALAGEGRLDPHENLEAAMHDKINKTFR